MIGYLRYSIGFLIFLLFNTASAWADIYKFIDEDGTICFTDSPPKGKKVIKILSEKERKDVSEREKNLRGGRRSDSARLIRTSYHTLVHKIANEYYIDPELVKAVITAESNWDPFAVSKKGAMGLMQLMPSTASLLNVRNPYDPEENIRAGIRYLRYLIDRFNGDIVLALAAYNAGPSVVERFGRIPPIAETLAYVKKVLSLSGYNKYYPRSTTRKKEKIYMIRLPDGSILYTNYGPPTLTSSP